MSNAQTHITIFEVIPLGNCEPDIVSTSRAAFRALRFSNFLSHWEGRLDTAKLLMGQQFSHEVIFPPYQLEPQMTATTTQDLIHVPDQPQVFDGLEYLGTSHFGDIRVNLLGTVHYVGTRISDIDLEDVAIAGTTISLRDSLDSAEWARLQREAIEQYERGLVAVTDWRGRVTWRAA